MVVIPRLRRRLAHRQGISAAGQTGGALYTMAVLQPYQVILLKDLTQGKGVSLGAVQVIPYECAVQKRRIDIILPLASYSKSCD